MDAKDCQVVVDGIVKVWANNRQRNEGQGEYGEGHGCCGLERKREEKKLKDNKEGTYDGNNCGPTEGNLYLGTFGGPRRSCGGPSQSELRTTDVNQNRVRTMVQNKAFAIQFEKRRDTAR